MLIQKIGKLRTNTHRLRHDLMNLELHVKAFNRELLATWQADALTRLIEVIYERHGWKFPGRVAVGDHIYLPRETLSTLYLKALVRIKKETVTKRFGLPMRYWHALQRYHEVSLTHAGVSCCLPTGPLPHSPLTWGFRSLIYGAPIPAELRTASLDGWSP